jgi:hypothetical protein
MPLPANMYNYYSVATEVLISAYMGCDRGLFRHYPKKRGKAFTEQQINRRWIYLKGSAMTLFICDGTRELTEACTKTAALLRLPLKESSYDAERR